MTRRQRLQHELRQAKKEVEFYRSSVDQKLFQDKISSRKLKRSKVSEKFAQEFNPAVGSNLTSATVVDGAQDTTAVKDGDTDSTASTAVRQQHIDREWRFTQKLTDQQVTDMKRKKRKKQAKADDCDGDQPHVKKSKAQAAVPKTAAENKTFLKSLFSGGLNQCGDDAE